MTPMLAPHLAVSEFLATSHREWARANIDMWDASDAVRRAAEFRLGPVHEALRTLLGVPLHTNSGYRCAGLNRAVGGRPTSRHVLGLAIDVVPVGLDLHAAFRMAAAAMRAGALPGVDELIIEMSWLHVQVAEGDAARGLALVTEDGVHFTEWRA